MEAKQWNAGYAQTQLADTSAGLTFPMLIMYPTEAQEQTERLGPYALELAKGAAPGEGPYPLVLLSHGTGGTPLVYRTLARYLARSGFIVGMPEHPLNHRGDNRLEGTIQNLAYRPRHLRLAIDWFLGPDNDRLAIKPGAVSVIGHSLGGYTALAAAGGRPLSLPEESPDGQPQPIEVEPDDRIASLVLLAPASVWFRSKGALQAVDLPILMLDAEKDPFTPALHAQWIVGGVADPGKVQYETIAGAGHFSFLSPFPPEMRHPSFLPSQDPPGFDREAFHARLNAEITVFLRRQHGE